MRRYEWTENGRRRALIAGVGLEKEILLDLDQETYVEIEGSVDRSPALRANGGGGPRKSHPEAAAPEGDSLEAVDRSFDERQTPDRVETRKLPDEVIDGHRCSGYEQRSVFPDGHTEITRSYRAADLDGLPLRIETTTESGSTRVITERRDVRTTVPADAFTVPPNYKKTARH